MTTATAPITAPLPARGRFSVTPVVELAVLGGAIAIGIGSYFIITGGESAERLLSPPLVALLLVANLLPGIALLVLFGRRIARRRATLSPIGGTGRLHVRLVALFSVIAAVPTLLVVIFASLLFQYGVEFWFSDRARSMFEDASTIGQKNYHDELDRIDRAVVAMSGDLASSLRRNPIDSKEFTRDLFFQTYQRELSEAIIVHLTADGQPISLALVDPYDRDINKVVTPKMVQRIKAGEKSILVENLEAPGALTRLDYGQDNYLYVTRVFDLRTTQLLKRGKTIVEDYRALLKRSRSLQLRFNAALLGISLLIVGIAVWIALTVADRLVRPVGELVSAARRVERGDLTARVAAPKTQDEVGTLANAFNAMTGRLQEQTSALVAANDQLDSRRALIEAVMSGVTAGIISIDEDRAIRLINSSAMTLLGTGNVSPVGRPLVEVSPEISALLDGEASEAVVQVTARGEARTLAVKITGDEDGQVLTFDDITQQLLDQRRAAWSDVARRIAHEIKNPLTPIQLAAERLQRRYGKQIAQDDGTFARLTQTIVRQVGDLRRIVDEFSSFARMPKPVFRAESLVDIARQSLFLHEVAHSDIHFSLVHDDPPPVLTCDRRQIAQALTNIVKNAVEALETVDADALREVTVTLSHPDDGRLVTIAVADSGVGLPVERDRIIEPYMTTRARGTGLGLAIVKKIVEEHFGTIGFADRVGGGTIVTLAFDAAMLASLSSGVDEDGPTTDESRLTALTRNRNS
ncbi:ATP-binding protein [Sphingomonas sp. 28-63-12]|uniref:sensor histidine kinase n=1 Tax=Sphingomonas sp. 28-63-12 TaxID=1970434 RepID=UPI000BCA929F|nr:MAG: PAS domain-containing sensor histidine kinase [Sphingomonas sp. 28-63-12]